MGKGARRRRNVVVGVAECAPEPPVTHVDGVEYEAVIHVRASCAGAHRMGVKRGASVREGAEYIASHGASRAIIAEEVELRVLLVHALG